MLLIVKMLKTKIPFYHFRNIRMSIRKSILSIAQKKLGLKILEREDLLSNREAYNQESSGCWKRKALFFINNIHFTAQSSRPSSN